MAENAPPLAPGDPIAYSEEFLPGTGTFDDGERIRAAVFGHEHVDPKTMEVTIRPVHRTVATFEKGDIVVGEITYIRDILASVKVLGIRGKEDRSLHQPIDATLHVSKSDDRYIDDLERLYSAGDLIRAKVIGLRGGPQLATDRPEFGVLRSRSRDGNIMVRTDRDDVLEDPETGRRERRKIATDYGSGTL